jgi:hypothetical protein
MGFFKALLQNSKPVAEPPGERRNFEDDEGYSFHELAAPEKLKLTYCDIETPCRSINNLWK